MHSVTSINADFQLHSFTIVCCILPGLWRGGLSSLAAGERKGGSPGQEGGPPTADSGVTRLPFSFHSCSRADVSTALPVTSTLSITGKHPSQRLFPFSSCSYLNLGLGIETCGLRPPNYSIFCVLFLPEHLRQKPRNALLTISFHQEGHATGS